MRVLVVGGGAREHALVWKLSESPRLKKLYCAPGNPGTAQHAENIHISSTDIEALAEWAVGAEIDLTVVGPEAPLAAGLVDVFAARGLRVFGPTRAAAQLESSKSFAKEVLEKAKVRTARAESFCDYTAAAAYVREQGAPIVIKADGLAAGKGVVVAETVQEALVVLDEFMLQGKHGEAGRRVLIEEKLTGEEASLMAVIDGEDVLPFVVSQDYKRLADNNKGPNTGGMGAISPTPVLGDDRVWELVGEIFRPVLHELRGRGITYRGFLYAGVIVDESGKVRVIEFNCRLGDPETQVLLTRLRSDLLDVLDAAMMGRLRSVELAWDVGAAVCVVLASAGYPGAVSDEKEIRGLDCLPEGVLAFHGGTVFSGVGRKELRSKGGRVLSITARGATIEDAVRRAYEGVEHVSFEGMQYRRDIGKPRNYGI